MRAGAGGRARSIPVGTVWTAWLGIGPTAVHSTHSVGTKSANGLGLYDMSGNVCEWVEDIYDGSAYGGHERKNPIVRSGGSNRVSRGGSWFVIPADVRCAFRGGYVPAYRDFFLGFRLARTN